MLGASGVQIPENDLDNLKSTREEDGDFDTVHPHYLLDSEMLEGLDPKILGSQLKSTDFETLVLLRYILIFGLGVVTDFEVFFLRGSTLVEVILGSLTRFILFEFDLTLLDWSSTLFFMLLLVVCEILLFWVLHEGCDLLALVELFIPIEGNTGLLESYVLWESTCFLVLLDDVAGSANLTFLFLFNVVIATNFSLGFVKLGHVAVT
ncbi:hypothetical protein Tco_0892005 [Tanacetum coccineum]|uniref:Uncharacterized protein n=1 Tax=Tanacetum coccineum TaxID=301880 RepID=A0ABQ5C7S2_9ASTR